MNVKRLGFCLILGLSLACAQLSQGAQDALRQGKTLAAQALNTYDTANPDQDLWRAALEYGQEAERLAPERPEPQRFLAQVYTELGWWQRAWDAWTAYERFGGELDADAKTKFAEMSVSLGYSRYERGKLGDALDYYQNAAALKPETEDIYPWLALLHFELDNPQAALPYWQRAVSAQPDNLLFAAYLAQTEAQLAYGTEASNAFYDGLDSYEKGNLDEAMTAFAEASALNPAFEDALLYAARVSLELGQPEASLAYWQRVLALNPDHPEANVKLNLVQDQVRWGVEATAQFREGVAAYADNDLETAQSLFETVTNLRPRYTGAWAWLGRVTRELGQLEKAANAYERAAELEPDNSEYRRAYQALQARLQPQPQVEAPSEDETLEPETAVEEEAVEAESAAEEGDEAEAAISEAQAPALSETAPTEEPPPIEQGEEASANSGADLLEEQAVSEEEPTFNDASAEAAVLGTNDLADSLRLLSFNHTHYRNGNLKTSPVSFFDSLASPSFNFEQPVNYADGTLHQRLEVLRKPSDETVLYQVCLIPFGDITVAPACSDPETLAFTGRGVHTSQQALSSFTNYDAIDWSRGINEAVIVLRDVNGSPIGNTTLDINRQPEELDLYFPMSVQYNAVLVPEGGTFGGWPEAMTNR